MPYCKRFEESFRKKNVKTKEQQILRIQKTVPVKILVDT